jgi:hypothetical protein
MEIGATVFLRAFGPGTIDKIYIQDNELCCDCKSLNGDVVCLSWGYLAKILQPLASQGLSSFKRPAAT